MTVIENLTTINKQISMKLTHAGGIVMEIFAVTGYADILKTV